MRVALLALFAGEAAGLYGLWLAWPPLGFIAAGGQLVAYGLLRDEGEGA